MHLEVNTFKTFQLFGKTEFLDKYRQITGNKIGIRLIYFYYKLSISNLIILYNFASFVT